MKNSIKALYYLIIKGARIANINNYVKSGDETEIQLPESKKETKKAVKTISFRSR